MEERVRELLDELYGLEKTKKCELNNPEAAVLKLLPYRNRKTEHFVVLLVDNKNNFIGKKVVGRGTVDQAAVFPREVFRAAILKQASGIILGHNHPGGDAHPSRQDKDLTARIVEIGRILGVRILDHIIISRAGHYSFQDNGLL